MKRLEVLIVAAALLAHPACNPPASEADAGAPKQDAAPAVDAAVADAGADDAAFHYRYPIGAVLQQAAAHGDYFLEAIVVATAPGHTPRVSYRDRQYGYEASSFNRKRGHPPIRLVLVEEGVGGTTRRFRQTTFEEALPGAFSTASFMPEAVDRFLEQRATE